MNVKSELRVSVFGLLLLQLLTAVVALALFGRSVPDVERLMNDNVRSLAAVEEMQTALVLRQGGVENRARFEKALQLAQSNITDEAERQPLRAIEGSWRAAFDGDAASLGLVVDSMRDLSTINRDSIAASNETSRLAITAAGWAVVVLAAFGLLFGLMAVRRTNANVVAPITTIGDAIEAYRRGEKLRRCETSGLTHEFRSVADMLNFLMDDLQRATMRKSEGWPIWLNRLLDGFPYPVALVTADAKIVAANVSGLKWLSDVEVSTVLREIRVEAPDRVVELDSNVFFVRGNENNV